MGLKEKGAASANQAEAGGAAASAAVQLKKHSKRKKKPWWRRLLSFALLIAVLWVSGHFALLYVSHILTQNLISLSAPMEEGKASVPGMNMQDYAAAVRESYALSQAAYSPSSADGWADALRAQGYDNVQRTENGASFFYHYTSIYKKENVNFLFSSVNATVATKTIHIANQEKTLVAVAFRGTDTADVVDDFSDMFTAVNEDGIHKGFAWNANNFYKQCAKITLELGDKTQTLEQVLQEMKNEDSPYVMLVTGHSLGAAVADVLVGNVFYRAGVLPQNVAAVTYAAPKSAAAGYTYPYQNILNIISSDDIVPTVGADRQIGQNIIYHPSETFRQAHYGDAYNVGAALGGYNDFISAAATGFIAHNMITTYQAVAASLAETPEEYFSAST